MADFDLVYTHNKETGEVSRKEFSTVDYGVEDVYAFAGDAKRPVRVTEVGDLPSEVEYYFLADEKQGRPIRATEPQVEETPE